MLTRDLFVVANLLVRKLLSFPQVSLCHSIFAITYIFPLTPSFAAQPPATRTLLVTQKLTSDLFAAANKKA